MVNTDNNPYEPPRSWQVPAEAFGFQGGSEEGETYFLASRFVRLLAFVVDYSVAVALSYLLFLLLLSLTMELPGADEPPSGPEAMLRLEVLLALSLPLLWILYFAGQESSRYQATAGKRLLGIRIVCLSGDRLGFWRAVWRTFVKFIGVSFFYLGWLVALFNANRQAAHDFAAGTVVVYTAPLPKKKVADPIDEL